MKKIKKIIYSYEQKRLTIIYTDETKTTYTGAEALQKAKELLLNN